MTLFSLVPALLLLSSAPDVSAWGTLGHETVAYLATNFVASETKTYFQNLLHNDTTSYLAGVATWADSFRYTAAGRFSAPFHFIDANDDPPTTCGVTFSRDCPQEGCVISAIQNYTSQILNEGMSANDRYIAAKFVVHFLGDIHQPLHDENLDIGGNSIAVLFNGVKTNLHHIWDTNMPEKLIGGYAMADAEAWAASLTTAITSGIYQDQAASWLEGIDLSDPVSTALIWASEANVFVCTTVMPDGVTSLEGQELSGEYYESAVPVIQLQVARAGLRLARWLDLIASAGDQEEL